MYKKIITAAITLNLAIFAVVQISLSNVSAQNSPPADPYQNYLKSLNEFYKFRTTFETSRSRYNSFKTIAAKDSAIKDAKTMLQKSNETLRRYIVVLGGILQSADQTNPEVQQRIIDDLRIHGEYLTSVDNTLPLVPTFEEINAYSEALKTRFGYINSTSQQATAYVDTIKVIQLIEELKQIINDIDALNKALPQNVEQTQLVQSWITQATQETSSNEETVRLFLTNIYPQSTLSSTQELRAFEGQGITFSIAVINEIKSDLRKRINEAEDTFNVVKEIYQEL